MRRLLRYTLVGLLITNIRTSTSLDQVNASGQQDSNERNVSASHDLRTLFSTTALTSAANLRKTKIFFHIQDQGQVYAAHLVEDLSVQLPTDNDLESVLEYVYSRQNWYIVNSQSTLVLDPDKYSELAWIAGIAYLGVTTWIPENFRSHANLCREILALSSLADTLQWIGEAAASLLFRVITGGSSLVIETGETALEWTIKQLATQIVKQVEEGLTDPVTYMKNINRLLILDSIPRLEQAATFIEPIYEEFRRDYPNQQVYVSSAEMEQFYKDATAGYSDSHGGMVGLTKMYDKPLSGVLAK